MAQTNMPKANTSILIVYSGGLTRRAIVDDNIEKKISNGHYLNIKTIHPSKAEIIEVSCSEIPQEYLLDQAKELEIAKLKLLNRKLTTELIQVKEEKTHNEQLLDAFQNTLAEFGYKLVSTNE